LLVTVSILQLLLALLDDLLRREWMRYVAAFCFTFTIIGLQLGMRRTSAPIAAQANRAGVTPHKLLGVPTHAVASVPTVSAPASLAGAHPEGWLASPLAGLAVSLALLAVPLALGAAVMARAVLRAPAAGTLAPRRAEGARGSLGPRLPGLTRTQS